MILCTHWEPVTRDSWSHLFWHVDDDWFDRDVFGHNRWFLGDDFIVPEQRASLVSPWHVTATLGR